MLKSLPHKFVSLMYHDGDRIWITHNFISPCKRRGIFRDTCLACYFFIASIGSIVAYAYLEIASMNIRVYFYPSKPYKRIATKLQCDPKKYLL